MPRQEGYIQISTEALRGKGMRALVRAGVPEDEAEIIIGSLVEADQRGVYTHGCVCLPRYIGLMRSGRMNPACSYHVLRTGTAMEVWDGERSNGQVLGHRAMLRAMALAEQSGIGLVGVRNSNHFGAGAYYAQLAQRAGMIGIAMSTGSSTMAPWGGADRLIGNNPVAIAVPARRHMPLVLDMAQSVVAFGQISKYKLEGKPSLPEGWALDRDGNPTTDVDAAYTVQPVGRHKGFGMALMVDVLSGLLLGAGTGDAAADEHDGPGCLFAAISIDAFTGRDALLDAVDARIDALKQSALRPGVQEILMPGEIEGRNAREAGETVWIHPKLVEQMDALA